MLFEECSHSISTCPDHFLIRWMGRLIYYASLCQKKKEFLKERPKTSNSLQRNGVGFVAHHCHHVKVGICDAFERDAACNAIDNKADSFLSPIANYNNSTALDDWIAGCHVRLTRSGQFARRAAYGINRLRRQPVVTFTVERGNPA